MENDVLEVIAGDGIVPVIVIDDADKAVPLGQALLAGGIHCIEITLRTEAALDSIEKLRTTLPQLLVGAGTVLSIEQASEAISRGAQFMVTPGYDEELVDWCMEQEMPIVPGAVTPTEITLARKKGLRVLKFFPAELMGGAKAIKTIAGPFQDIKFMPTGGINLSSLPEYLALPMIHACGGSWMAGQSLIAENRWDEITRLSSQSIEIVQQSRS